MNTNWVKVQIDDLNVIPNLDRFESNEDGLFIELSFNGVVKTLFFEDFYAFRSVDEGKAFGLLGKYDVDTTYWLFENKDSDLKIWFDSESAETYKDEYTPYIVVCLHHFIEILTVFPPRILD
jgi:hypothetical protein